MSLFLVPRIADKLADLLLTRSQRRWNPEGRHRQGTYADLLRERYQHVRRELRNEPQSLRSWGLKLTHQNAEAYNAGESEREMGRVIKELNWVSISAPQEAHSP